MNLWELSEQSQKPFKCSYCPYSASQKGNLKTHVLCVHRMPFDNTQYPDRRFKRSRPESDSPDKSPTYAVGGFASNQPVTEVDCLPKGSLKTHVLCVHRILADNTQYPDPALSAPVPSPTADKAPPASVALHLISQ
ncbi:zinc finger protein 536 isoform X1 [Lates japonicus]|uniref:Zinc finger protein 536 isoform X1 n=1 Tax=Lates japonicus TaxID=270547 RepID=A0AAD3MJ93_LATJO|nr:zinc finger protein 536 isoform X1 [Lates japonicus]